MKSNQSSSSSLTAGRLLVAFSFITPTPRKLTGLSSYADSLISAFADFHMHLTIKLITNADAAIFHKINKCPNIRIVRLGDGGELLYKIWSIYAHVKAGLMARLQGVTCLASVTPQGSFIPLVNQIITIHDTYDLEREFKSLFHVIYSRLIRKLSIRMAKGVVCVSETTFNDICSILRPTTSKFTVIKEASKYQPTNPNWVESETPSDSRFLFVANVEKTKNVVCLLEALRLAQGRGLSIQVDWIGRDPNYLVENWLREKGNLANFFPRGYVEDDELRVAYRDSLALVVPSLREGFCLPVLEAHSFGTPVIGSDIPILREVVGGGGIFFDASDPEALLRALMVMSSDVDLRLALRQQAIANARLYSWDRSARELSQFATKCCDPGADGT